MVKNEDIGIKSYKERYRERIKEIILYNQTGVKSDS